MYERFGEFDSAAELNAKAKELKGDKAKLLELAEENGIDKEDAEDYVLDCADGYDRLFVTPFQAAIGKLDVEAEDLKLEGVLADWKDTVIEMCATDDKLCAAVRRKKYNLKGCMASLLAFAFENKRQVSPKVVAATKIKRGGKAEPMKGPLYMGAPNRAETKKIILEYYGVGE